MPLPLGQMTNGQNHATEGDAMNQRNQLRQFDPLLNWRLLVGSHRFPGPDGGTCVNEAAVIAAGFPYRSVVSWHDCPPCFSPPISHFALSLNDYMPDKLRHLLLPFVTRLAGTAGPVHIEMQRAYHLLDQVYKRLIKPWMPQSLHHMALGQTDRARHIAEDHIPPQIYDAITNSHHAYILVAHAYGHSLELLHRLGSDHKAEERIFFNTTCAILSEAIDLGPHDPVPPTLATTRLREALPTT